MARPQGHGHGLKVLSQKREETHRLGLTLSALLTTTDRSPPPTVRRSFSRGGVVYGTKVLHARDSRSMAASSSVAEVVRGRRMCGSFSGAPKSDPLGT